MRFSRNAWLVVVAVVCAAAGLWRVTRPDLPRTVRVGYGGFAPYLFVGADGKPEGFAIDAFEAAAGRRGIAIAWVEAKGGPDKALETGQIDLYPMLARSPERIVKLGISEPWWENSMAFASRAEHPVRVVADLDGKTMALMGNTLSAALARREFPRAIAIETPQSEAILEPLCDGRAAAALVEMRNMNLWLARAKRPCPGISFHVQPFERLVLRYGVGATKEKAWLATEMQEALLDLAIDGTLTSIGARHNVFATNQIGLFRDLIRVKGQRWWLAIAVLLLVAALGGAARLYLRSREARKVAEQASATQSQFLANVSHEIRTPLNGILGMVELLRSTGLQAAQRDFTEAISSSGQVLLALINDFLDLAKIEAGKLELERISFSPVKVTEQVVQTLYPRAHEAGIAIGAFVDPAISGTVLADPTRIQQVLFNLVGNAVKFTSHGEVWVEVDRLGEGALRFRVSDTGVGVPPAARERLFQRFTQADASTTRQHGGTGLGLAICQDLVRLMGGTLGYNPRPGGGSEFWFTVLVDGMGASTMIRLGRRVAVAESVALDVCGTRLLERMVEVYGCVQVAPGEAADLILGRETLAPPIRQSHLLETLLGTVSIGLEKPFNSLIALGLRVLVAEDNVVNQRVAMHYLKKLGCEAILVENGKLAVAEALATDYDVVLMDYQMPVMDGLKAAGEIRAAGGKRSEVPILAVTAGVLAVDREKIRAAGMDDLLPKPYSLDALRAALEAASRVRRGTFQK